MEYFQKHPNRDIPHPEIVDWATSELKKRTGEVFRDPDRQIRQLSQKGYLIKVSKGVYRFEPDAVNFRELEEFTPSQKKTIFERDVYKCVICGRGEKEGFEIHADHIKPRELGGKATIENGQTLCSQHNIMKKALKQTETGKKMFIHLYKLAKKENDKNLVKFFTEVLEIYEKNKINCHIVWKK
jgi:hypothetical protein